MQNMNIANIAGGALIEQVDVEIKRVLENIMDPNTETKKKRKITIVLEFECDDNRDVSDVKFVTKSVLAPQRAIVARIAFDKDAKGKIVAEELGRSMTKGQVWVDEFGEINQPATKASIPATTVSRVVNIK
jgi:hypothetical protein